MIKSYGFLYLENSENKFHYSYKLNKWVSKEEYLHDGDTYHFQPAVFGCRSLKAAKRHLRKHGEIPKGTRFVLVNKFVNYDIELVKK